MLRKNAALLFTMMIASGCNFPDAIAKGGTTGQQVSVKATAKAAAKLADGSSTAATTGDPAAAHAALKAALAKMTPEQRAAYRAMMEAKRQAKEAAKQAANRVGNPWGPYDPYHYQSADAISIDNQDIPQGLMMPITRLGGDGMGGL